MTQRLDGPFRGRVGAHPDPASRVYLRELAENGSDLRRTLGWGREQFHVACGGIEMVGALEDYVRHGGRTLRIGGGRYESGADAANRPNKVWSRVPYYVAAAPRAGRRIQGVLDLSHATCCSDT